MIELFAGHAILTSVAKEFGMLNSIALDKIRKPGTRASIFVFDLLRESDRDLLMQWLNSKQL